MAVEKLEVIVVGAGSTGLLLAQGLKQQGVAVSIFEREDPTTYQTRPREWGMTLHWGLPYISECIPSELRDGLNAGICCDPYYEGKDLTLPHYNAETGEKLFDMPGHEPRRISRKKLRNYLSQGLDVKYGKKLKLVTKDDDDHITAAFEDGTSVTGNVLVGCDGANSAVRPFLVGEDKAQNEDLDIQMFNLSCTFPKDISMLQRNAGHPVFKNSYHPNGFMWWQSIQDLGDPEKPETWLWQNCFSWIGAPRAADLPDQASRTKYWKEQAQHFAEPWKSVGEALRDDLVFPLDSTTAWTPTDWSASPLAGYVTLAGDAAHAMPPHRGQGLNNALEDAAKLVAELGAASRGQKTRATALRDYETEMKDRVLTEIPISTAQARMVHSYDTLMDAPFFKMGMNKYREDRAAAGKSVEKAAEPKEV